MVKIDGFPLLHENECKELFSPEGSFANEYFIKPIYKWLPDFSDLDEDEKQSYRFRNLKEGMYLTGLKVISEKWVNRGFCGMLLNSFGLVLDEAYPAEIKNGKYNTEETLIYLNFDHVSIGVYNKKVIVNTN